jgi:hypothetical protein
MAKSGHKGICRIDQPARNTFGWYVRVQFNGKNRSKFFSDKVYEGRQKALEEAIRFRNKTEQEMAKPRTDRVVMAHNPRNNTGVMGVRRRVKSVKGENGEPVERSYFEVTWNPWPGKVCSVRISIDDLGEAAALKKASAIRRQKERETFGEVIKPNWAAALGKLLSD